MPKQIKVPKPATIRRARLAIGLTQTQAAQLIHRTERAWQYYEAGTRAIDLCTWELWQHKAAAFPRVKAAKGARS